MKMTKFVTFAIACVVLFSACNKDEFDGIENPLNIEGEGQISLVLTDSTIPADTRSNDEEDGKPGESNINVVEFYVFNGQTPDTKTPYKKYPTAAAGERFTFDVDAAGGKTVLAAINMNLGNVGGNLNDVKKAMLDVEISNRVGISANIPMSGEYKNLTVGNGDVERIVLEVSRLYARFNAPNATGAETKITKASELDSLAVLLPGVSADQVGFELKGHVVINGLKKSFAFPNYGTAEENRWVKTTWEIGNDRDNYTKSEYNAAGGLGTVYSGGSFLTTESVYLYENCPVYVTSNETGTSSGYRASSVYSFIIEGELFNKAIPATRVTRYWRINVSKTDDDASIFKILRNAIYNVNIKDVKTVGYGTPEEAEDDDEDENGGGVIPGVNNAAIEVQVKVLSWRVFNEDSDI